MATEKVFRSQDIQRFFLALLESAKGKLSVKAQDGTEAPAEIRHKFEEKFDLLKAMVSGDFDSLTVKEFRARLLGE